MIHFMDRQALLYVGCKVTDRAFKWTISAMILHVTIKIPFVLKRERSILDVNQMIRERITLLLTGVLKSHSMHFIIGIE